jgi:hypothetical protein
VAPRPFDRLNRAASAARDEGRLLIATTLIGGVVAAAFDVVRWDRGDLDLAAFAGAAAFLVASATLAHRRPDRR